jgi:hypothetical protein
MTEFEAVLQAAPGYAWGEKWMTDETAELCSGRLAGPVHLRVSRASWGRESIIASVKMMRFSSRWDPGVENEL